MLNNQITIFSTHTILTGEKFPWSRTDPKRPSPVLESGWRPPNVPSIYQHYFFYRDRRRPSSPVKKQMIAVLGPYTPKGTFHLPVLYQKESVNQNKVNYFPPWANAFWFIDYVQFFMRIMVLLWLMYHNSILIPL